MRSRLPPWWGKKVRRKEVEIMLLWRAMSADEFAAFERGEKIRAFKMSTAGRVNTWKGKPRICFFGTANNAIHWASPLYGHDYVVGLEFPAGTFETGCGRYKDFSTDDMFDNVCVMVKEYAVKSYSQRTARFVRKIDIEDKWKCKDYGELQKVIGIPLFVSYDDLAK